MVLPFLLVFIVSTAAYCTAQTKLDTAINLDKIKIGISPTQLEKIVGKATSSHINQLTYIFEDGTEMKVSLTEGLVSGAVINYKNPPTLQDPEKLTFLQVNTQDSSDQRNWFYVGKPEDGQIFKINMDGKVKSLTLVPPFQHKSNTPKHFQALLRDFQDPESPRM